MACLKIIEHLVSEDLYEALESSIKEIEDVLSCIAKYMVYNYEIMNRFSKNIQAKVLCCLVLDAFKINVS